MIKLDNAFWSGNSLKAWEELNELFLKPQSDYHFRFGHNALYIYDLVLGIRNPKLPEDFDFGRHFNYTINKWKTLVSNYIDKEALAKVKEEVKAAEAKKNKVYNISMNFTNTHGHGKSCLLAMVFSHRLGETKATISIQLRASEVTKRLVCDLLLFQRIGEYVYGEGNFQIVIYFNQIFQDDTVLLMYHAHKDVRKILKGTTGERTKNLLELLDKLESKNPEEVKYKVHRRAAKVLHPELYKYPKTLVKNCTL